LLIGSINAIAVVIFGADTMPQRLAARGLRGVTYIITAG